MGEMHISKDLSTLGPLIRLLRPVAWLCLRRSWYIQDAIEALKLSFIDVAERELRKKGEKLNVSRLSVVTGLRRREVQRLYLNQSPRTDEISLVTKIIGQWASSKRFTTMSGRPKTLDPYSDFPALVRSVSNDLHPATVLFELGRLGIIKETKFGLKLLKPGLVARNEVNLGYRLLSEDMEDLVGAVEENLEARKGPRPNPHAKTYFDNIDRSSLPKIRRWLRKENKRVHRRLRDYLSQFDLDLSSREGKQGGSRVAFGTFGRIQE